MSGLGDRAAARSRLIQAVLRVLASDYEDEPYAHSADEADYADEQMALAARELYQATMALPQSEQPVGW